MKCETLSVNGDNAVLIGNVKVVLVRGRKGEARLAIEAPKEVPIRRTRSVVDAEESNRVD